MRRTTLAFIYGAQAAASAGIGALYLNIGKSLPGILWLVTAGIQAVTAIGTAMAWTLDRERRRWTP